LEHLRAKEDANPSVTTLRPSGKRKFGGQFAVIIATELISAETPIVVSQIDGVPVPVAAYIWTAVGSAARRRFARSIWLADHQCGDTSKLSGTLNRSTF